MTQNCDNLQDLIWSGQKDSESSIFMGLTGFWSYKNREVLVANDNNSTTDPKDLSQNCDAQEDPSPCLHRTGYKQVLTLREPRWTPTLG